MTKQELDNIRKRSPIWEYFLTLFVLVIIGVNAYLAFSTVNDLSHRHRSITNTGNVIVEIKELHQSLLAAELGELVFLLVEDDTEVDPYLAALEDLDLHVKSVRHLRTEIPGQAEDIRLLVDMIRQRIAQLRAGLELSLADKHERAINKITTRKGVENQKKIAELFDRIETREFALQGKLYSQMVQSDRKSRNLFIAFLVISSLLVVGVFTILKLTLRREAAYREKLQKRADELEDKVRQRTQEITLYSEELARSNQELEDFAFVASHDLQEPLRKICTFSDRMNKKYAEQLDEKGRDYLVRLNGAATRMSVLIHNLLEFSRIRTRGKPFVTVDLDQLIAVIIDDLEVAIETNQAVISIDALPSIKADESQMTQLFLNLLSNAIKFRKPDVTPIVQVRYALVQKEAMNTELSFHEIRVQDNGIGFDMDYKDKIFVPFQRLHARDEYQGTGIGLAVCRRIVERHGGTIDVESAVGEGSTFIIHIPVVSIDMEGDISEAIEKIETQTE